MNKRYIGKKETLDVSVFYNEPEKGGHDNPFGSREALRAVAGRELVDFAWVKKLDKRQRKVMDMIWDARPGDYIAVRSGHSKWEIRTVAMSSDLLPNGRQELYLYQRDEADFGLWVYKDEVLPLFSALQMLKIIAFRDPRGDVHLDHMDGTWAISTCDGDEMKDWVNGGRTEAYGKNMKRVLWEALVKMILGKKGIKSKEKRGQQTF